MKQFWIILVFFCAWQLNANDQIARLHYSGGGDWYNDSDAIPNLCKFTNQQIKTNFKLEEAVVKPSDNSIFNYPFLFVTGHGNISFDDQERENLRSYLLRGGFIYFDDDYGMDSSLRQEIAQLLPEYKLIELPANHEIFTSYYKFPKGLPKIHKHDEKRPQAFAVFDSTGRLLILYTFESNISDGWSDAHQDSKQTKLQALQMGANIIHYLITN